MITDLNELLELGGIVATITAAHQTGLLDSLTRPAPPDKHAQRVRLHPDAVSLVLGTLVALGVAETRGGRVGAAEALSSETRNLVDDVLRVQELWRHLPGFLQTGKRWAHMDGSAGERSAS